MIRNSDPYLDVGVGLDCPRAPHACMLAHARTHVLVRGPRRAWIDEWLCIASGGQRCWLIGRSWCDGRRDSLYVRGKCEVSDPAHSARLILSASNRPDRIAPPMHPPSTAAFPCTQPKRDTDVWYSKWQQQ